jgi:glutaryl-CoA dehydrogenase
LPAAALAAWRPPELSRVRQRKSFWLRETVGFARELLGANGILLDYQIGRFVADAEAIYSYEGTREMNTLIVGKAITGFSAFI